MAAYDRIRYPSSSLLNIEEGGNNTSYSTDAAKVFLPAL